MQSTIFMSCAGSGKTSRLINILKDYLDKNQDPSRVLVISYTNNAVEEIADRLQSSIPQSTLDLIHLHTLHSFCFSYLVSSSLLEENQVIEKLPANIQLLIPKKLLNPLKIQNWELTRLLENIPLESLYYGFFNEEDYTKNPLITTIEKNIDFQKNIKNILDFFKNTLSKYTFIDLIVEMYKLLYLDYNHLLHAMNLWNSYDLILIDEMQDFSPMQLQILLKMMEEIIFNYSANKSENEKEKMFFLFGDIKQSIFNFQGANLDFFKNSINNIFLLAKKYKYPLAVEKINTTHRLSININSFVNSLHKFNKMRDFEEHQTTSFTTGEVYYYSPRINSNDTKVAEDICKVIKDLIENNTKPSDIMLVFRTRDSLIYKIADKLKEKELDSKGLDIINLNQSNVVLLLKNLNKVLSNPEDLESFRNFVSSYYLSYLSPEDFENFLILFKDQASVEVLMNYLESLEYLKESLSIIKKNKYGSSVINVYDFIVNVLIKDLIFSKIIAAEDKDVLFNIMQQARDFSGCLEDFLESLPLNIKKENYGIEMQTVYGSKGLQSKVVIICDGHKAAISRDWRNEFFYYYEDFKSLEDKNESIRNKKEEIYREYLRLMYVAATRASERLFIFGLHPLEINSLLWFIKEIGFKTDSVNYGDVTLNKIKF